MASACEPSSARSACIPSISKAVEASFLYDFLVINDEDGKFLEHIERRLRRVPRRGRRRRGSSRRRQKNPKRTAFARFGNHFNVAVVSLNDTKDG